MTINKLFNLPQTSLRDQTVTEAVEAQAKQQARSAALEDEDIEETRRIAMTVNVFARRPMRWLNVDQAYTLSLGDDGWVALRPDAGERWGVWVINKSASATPLSQGLTLEGAQVVAEDYVRQSGAVGLSWRGASWSQRPVTDYPKMQRKLQWLRIPVIAGMTAGQASDLIGQAELRKHLQRLEVTHG